ncbi:ABC transporter ATP-binding protein [Citricoccus muralis]|uniref:NitT/TauT family transport system ATP-binding protein n=1 Tax=Citricoccus muralis TaxID=169134 RepID=A0A3D9LAP4_9MICC|nr:ABC transporter ATP-binding protein [Citricoccus muralis]REE02930.1 NitT/TauT family transport system ATP-binding protein [Citricoccus muralis]
MSMQTQPSVATPEPAAPDSSPEIRISGLGKTYKTERGTTHALSDINLDIRKEEFVSLIGRSGCGKTTLLRIMAGLVPPTAGHVEIGGRALWHHETVDSSVIRRLGVVFQDSNLFPWYNIEDNIALPLRLRGVKKNERRDRVRELAELVGLQNFLPNYPRELSGGMRQRVAIARALSDNPELLLMDEPFGALDALTREKMNMEIQRIALATRATVVFVTHDIDEAVALGDRVVHLTPRPGRIKDVVEVPLARPRGVEIKKDAAFHGLVGNLHTSLNEEDDHES